MLTRLLLLTGAGSRQLSVPALFALLSLSVNGIADENTRKWRKIKNLSCHMQIGTTDHSGVIKPPDGPKQVCSGDTDPP